MNRTARLCVTAVAIVLGCTVLQYILSIYAPSYHTPTRDPERGPEKDLAFRRLLAALGTLYLQKYGLRFSVPVAVLSVVVGGLARWAHLGEPYDDLLGETAWYALVLNCLGLVL